MPQFPTVRVAAVQATPVVLDVEATVDKVVRLIGEAAAEGPSSWCCPECLRLDLPHPMSGHARPRPSADGWGELWERMWALSSSTSRARRWPRIADACPCHDVHCVIGVNEREDERPGTLYNAMLVIGPGRRRATGTAS